MCFKTYFERHKDLIDLLNVKNIYELKELIGNVLHLDELLKIIERKTGVKLPRKTISVSINEEILHIRFNYPKTKETNVEPLPFKTPVFLFRDEETNEITALKILDINEFLSEQQRNRNLDKVNQVCRISLRIIL